MRTVTATGKSKKQGLGKGLDSLIPPQTVRIEEPVHTLTDIQRFSEATSKITAILCNTLPGMDEHVAERMLRMIISLCQSELKGGCRS